MSKHNQPLEASKNDLTPFSFPFSLVDTHAHLDDEQFAPDLPAVLDRAHAAGVERILTIATSASSSAKSIELARKYPELSASVGIQPNNLSQAAPGDWDEVVRLSAHPAVRAIGETGLDRHWDYAPFDLQQEYFARHLALARDRGLAVVIHCREAEADVVSMLKSEFERHGPIRGVMHSFTGDASTASQCIAMGLHISFAGMVTFKNAHALREVALQIPPESLLVETDSPYLSPAPLRGKRNEPAHLVHTLKCLADLRGIEPETLAELTSRNAIKLFGLP
jgi:TatD DNase family protein